MNIIQEDYDALQTYLNSNLFINEHSDKNIAAAATVEFIVRPDCNQKCKYCYLKQHGNELYPDGYNIPKEKIVHNIHILLDYFYSRKCYLRHIELFAGDMFYDGIIFDIFDELYKYYEKIQNEQQESLLKNLPEETDSKYKYYQTVPYNMITIPCNLSFVQNDELINKFISYYVKFNKINTILFLSYSTDGLYAIDSRERKTLNQEWFDKTLMLCKDFHFGCHPMISYENIDHWKENYEWWKSMYQKYFWDDYDKLIIPSSLEVRNGPCENDPGWTQEKINKYLELLDYMIEDRLKLCNNDKELFTRELFEHHSNPDPISYPHGPFSMDPIKIVMMDKHQNEMSCGMGHDICINCNRLTVVPCHRMAYPFFEGMKFTTNEDNTQITDIIPLEAINSYLNMHTLNNIYKVKCVGCKYRFLCIKGCLGAQFEDSGDPYVPIPSVCELFKQKTDFLLKKYHELGIFHILFQSTGYHKNELGCQRIKELLILEGYNEYEQY